VVLAGAFAADHEGAEAGGLVQGDAGPVLRDDCVLQNARGPLGTHLAAAAAPS
jgi:hypothetical protein